MERGHTWPPRSVETESDSAQRLYRFREKEIMSLVHSEERWENWLQFVQSRAMRTFTPTGFKLVQTPAHVQKKLADALQHVDREWERLPEESVQDVIFNPTGAKPKIVRLRELAWEVLEDLRPMHEEWAGGIKLTGTSAYGVRLYVNQSSLAMHVDKSETHVISSIVHILHKYDSEARPWPIEIEDHDGYLHAVNLG